uniref:Uncharacterized protein n=1 Tax=Rhizophora mucronata TaxID=61149 RepID=A0A2P2NLN7_RHIMU
MKRYSGVECVFPHNFVVCVQGIILVIKDV